MFCIEPYIKAVIEGIAYDEEREPTFNYAALESGEGRALTHAEISTRAEMSPAKDGFAPLYHPDTHRTEARLPSLAAHAMEGRAVTLQEEERRRGCGPFSGRY